MLNYQVRRFYQTWINRLLFLMILVLLSCGSSQAAAGPSIKGTVKIVDRQGRLKSDHSGVVVFLDEVENIPDTSTFKFNEKAVIRQINKRFIPEILPIMVGTTVDFPNDDTIYHNIFSLSKAKPFDLGIYEQGNSKSVTFDQPGLVKVYCNIHPQMLAYILVLTNPYFTITDNNGHFVLSDAPLGSATIRTFYPLSRKYPEQKVRITEEGIRDLNLTLMKEAIDFQIQEEAIFIKHKNKWGKDYSEKY